MKHNFFQQYQSNVSRHCDYLADKDLPYDAPASNPLRYIAFYLPQFHTIPENDEWWGTGFTEWTNVTKALPRYDGHLQPRLPSDLGFYNLRDIDVIRKQAGLAKRAGIAGFCIHDYWFSGRKVLETPVQLLLDNTDIDLPFCLNWANENWSRRWDGLESDVLLEQKYDCTDDVGYVKSILPALADARYLRVGHRPIIMVYRPECIPEPRRMFDAWRDFLFKEGFGEPYLVKAQNFAHPSDDPQHYDPRVFGMDAAVGFPPHIPDLVIQNDVQFRDLFDLGYQGNARPYWYLAQQMLKCHTKDYVNFPGVSPGWDNEARKPGRGISFFGANPEAYRAWLSQASAQALSHENPDEQIVFLNAWNEWAEGAILEPDRHFGHAFLVATRSMLDEISSTKRAPILELAKPDGRSSLARVRNRTRRQLGRLLQNVVR